jgi:hypothetical protein
LEYLKINMPPKKISSGLKRQNAFRRKSKSKKKDIEPILGPSSSKPDGAIQEKSPVKSSETKKKMSEIVQQYKKDIQPFFEPLETKKKMDIQHAFSGPSFSNPEAIRKKSLVMIAEKVVHFKEPILDDTEDTEDIDDTEDTEDIDDTEDTEDIDDTDTEDERRN